MKLMFICVMLVFGFSSNQKSKIKMQNVWIVEVRTQRLGNEQDFLAEKFVVALDGQEDAVKLIKTAERVTPDQEVIVLKQINNVDWEGLEQGNYISYPNG